MAVWKNKIIPRAEASWCNSREGNLARWLLNHFHPRAAFLCPPVATTEVICSTLITRQLVFHPSGFKCRKSLLFFTFPHSWATHCTDSHIQSKTINQVWIKRPSLVIIKKKYCIELRVFSFCRFHYLIICRALRKYFPVFEPVSRMLRFAIGCIFLHFYTAQNSTLCYRRKNFNIFQNKIQASNVFYYTHFQVFNSGLQYITFERLNKKTCVVPLKNRVI